MGRQAFDFGDPPQHPTGSFTGNGAYNEGVAVPAGRSMANGAQGIVPTGIVMYLGGNGGARSGTIYVGGSSLPLGIPSGSGGQAVGGSCTVQEYITPGTIQVGFLTNGLTNYGWSDLAGRTIKQQGTNSTLQSSGQLSGYYDYAEAPSAPQNLTIVPGTGTADLSWYPPADSGGASILGYVVEYATNSSFSGKTQVAASGLSKTITGLTPGQQYWFRVVARNGVSDAAGSSSVVSNTVSALLGIGGARWNGSAEVPLTVAMRWDGSKEVPITVGKRWNGSSEVTLS